MTVTFLEVVFSLLALLLVNTLTVIGAVALGGALVFRTKRDSHEPLFTLRPPTGGAGNVDEVARGDMGPAETMNSEPDPVAERFKVMEQRNLEFLKRLAKEKETGGERISQENPNS